MNILILDDETIRHDRFEKDLGQNHTLYHAYNKEQYEMWLSKKIEFDVIMFDHDLGINNFTGYDAAKLLIDKIQGGMNRPQLCVVHSWNPVGADQIVKLLKAFGLNVERKMFSS